MPLKVRNILLIDDDEDDQEIFLTAIERINTSLQCSVCSNVPDALEKLVSGSVQPDIIFLDLNMPAINGLQFLEQVRNERKLQHIPPIIILSTSSHPATIAQTKELGAVGFISKPEKFEDLINQLKELTGN